MLRGISSKFSSNFAQLRQFSTSPKQLFIYKTLDNVRKDGQVKKLASEAFESRRYILLKHGMGFSFHETVVYKGKCQFFDYANHLQAVMVTHGSGCVEIVDKKEDKGKGRRFVLKPGAMYALDNHEKHWLCADEDSELHCVAVFTPPIQGTEYMNDEGVLPHADDEGNLDYEYWKKKEQFDQTITVKLKPRMYRDAHYYDLVKDAIHSS